MKAPVLSAAALALVAGRADARSEVHPYIEAQQVFGWSFGDGDSVTYTGVGAGVDAFVRTRRFSGQVSYRYDHYFSWQGDRRDGDIHNGLATGSFALTDEISLNGAGIAARSRGSFAAPSAGLLIGDFDNTQQLYAIQAGPSYAGRVGDVAVNANYRFGWSHVDNGFGDIDLGPGQPRIDTGFDQTSHTIDATIGQRAGVWLPFGWTVSGGYVRDDVHVLGARYEGTFGRVDVTQPITPTLAAVGGVGWERNRISQRQVLTDAAGNAILTDDRELRSDRSRPRVLIYDQDGLIWDVGVLWRPSARTSLEVRGGQRYGQTMVRGALTWAGAHQDTFQVVAYNDIQSSGRQLTRGIGLLPTTFQAPNAQIPIGIGGCVFGADGQQGGCLPGLNSTNTNFYRSRGVYALYGRQSGAWTYGLSVGYDHRRYLAADFTPGIVDYARVTDDAVTGTVLVTRALSPVSTISGAAYVAWYDTDFANSPSYTTYGGTAAYTRQFGRHLTGQAAISVFSGTGGGDFDQDTIGTAYVAVRYTL